MLCIFNARMDDIESVMAADRLQDIILALDKLGLGSTFFAEKETLFPKRLCKARLQAGAADISMCDRDIINVDMGSAFFVGMIISADDLEVRVAAAPAVRVFPEDLIAKAFFRGIIFSSNLDDQFIDVMFSAAFPDSGVVVTDLPVGSFLPGIVFVY